MNKKHLIYLYIVSSLILVSGCGGSYVPFDVYNKSSGNLTSDNPVYLKYYDEIRRKIYGLAYKNYNLFEQGKVTLKFVIFNDGKVGDIESDKTKTEASEELIGVAIKAVKKASPFLPFPDGLQVYRSLDFKIELAFGVDDLGDYPYSESSKCPFDNVEMKEIPIKYGKPGPKMLEEARQGRVILGGCFYNEDMPKAVYVCPVCKKIWYKREKANE